MTDNLPQLPKGDITYYITDSTMRRMECDAHSDGQMQAYARAALAQAQSCVPASTGWVARKDWYSVPVLFDPYTGEPRDARDIHSDPQGILIAVPGAYMVPASPQPQPVQPSEPIMVITGYQLREALDFLAPDGTAEQLEQSVCIQHGPERVCQDEPTDPAGLYCWVSDYPEEGAISLTGDDSVAQAKPEQAAQQTQAAIDVLAERQRQVNVGGWTPEHDDEHDKGVMAAAAACYALHTEPVGNVRDYLKFWPWDASWWKPGDRRRNLIKAGALILAEIERLDRAAAPQPKE